MTGKVQKRLAKEKRKKGANVQKKKRKKKNKKKKQGNNDHTMPANVQLKNSEVKANQENQIDGAGSSNSQNNKSKNRKRKRTDSDKKHGAKKVKRDKNVKSVEISDARLSAFGINPKKYKNKLKYGSKNKNK